ncbi:hypothetical protein ACFX1R_010635 [Malus domestica]
MFSKTPFLNFPSYCRRLFKILTMSHGQEPTGIGDMDCVSVGPDSSLHSPPGQPTFSSSVPPFPSLVTLRSWNASSSPSSIIVADNLKAYMQIIDVPLILQ